LHKLIIIGELAPERLHDVLVAIIEKSEEQAKDIVQWATEKLVALSPASGSRLAVRLLVEQRSTPNGPTAPLMLVSALLGKVPHCIN
jgi:hypothetical protein